MNDVRMRLRGLLACLAIGLLVVGLPALLLAIGTLPALHDLSLDLLMSADDGTLAITVITLAGWAAWIVMATTVVLEIWASVRGVRSPTLRGLAMPQNAAHRLVGVASLLFVALPTVQLTTATPAIAEPAVATPVTAPSTHAPIASAATIKAPAVEVQPETTSYTVRRGDSLWKIAEAHLGDGRRYTEIVALNPRALAEGADFITPGTTLRIPVDGGPETQEQHVVEPGDTLSKLAQSKYGDPDAWPLIYEASTSVKQPDGARLTDPNLILPGWRLSLPANSDTTTQKKAATPNSPPPRAQRESEPPPPETEPAAPSDHHEAAPTDPGSNEEASTDLPAWVLPGLAGSGVLAGSLFLVLRAHRRTQQRFRIPGHQITPPPDRLRSVEKSIRHVGITTAPRVAALRQALRHLARDGAPPPVNIVELAASEVRVHTSLDGTPPEGWTERDGLWIAQLDMEFETPDDITDPYPLLASIGTDPRGHLVLANLEALEMITLTGDHEPCISLARHLAAELALNPWSALVDVETIGIGDELASLDPLRLHQHDGSAASVLERLNAELESEDQKAEPDAYRAVILSGQQDPAGLGRGVAAVSGLTGRTGATIVAVTDELPHATIFQLTDEGRLRSSELALDITAAGLTSEEATACSSIIDVTRDSTNDPIPATTPPSPLAGVSDLAGALLGDYTSPRPTAPASDAGSRALLPRAADVYADCAPTRSDDVAQLAPAVDESMESRVAELDPTLDNDLAAWESDHTTVPRMTLLGPVSARTAGDAKSVAQRKPFYLELLAYLALHPRGVTGPQIADAFNLKPQRVRVDLATVRRWLGADPDTGVKYLPSARSNQRDNDHGAAVYQLQGVLTDLDLFTRLRTRGQSRGNSGIDDLVRALDLVTGEPFTMLRPAGWNWLLDGERTDHIASCAVVDVAHIVTTHALAENDLDLAQRASQIAHHAAPDDEVCGLDIVAVTRARGYVDRANELLRETVLDRSDDDLGVVDASARTKEILDSGTFAASRRTG